MTLGPQNVFAVQKDGFFWQKENAILVVLDISSSMSGEMLDSVRREMDHALSPRTFPSDGMAGLISFSGCEPADVRVEVPLTKGAAPQVLSRAHALEARDLTDIFNALVVAKKEALRVGSTSCTKVMILTDGMDSCSFGDVVAISADIAKISNCNQVSTISLGAAVKYEQTLKDISKAGRGEHHSVTDLFDLEETFKKTLENFNTTSQLIMGMRDWHGEDQVSDKKKNKHGYDGADKKGEDNEGDELHEPNSNASQQNKTRNN